MHTLMELCLVWSGLGWGTYRFLSGLNEDTVPNAVALFLLSSLMALTQSGPATSGHPAASSWVEVFDVILSLVVTGERVT